MHYIKINQFAIYNLKFQTEILSTIYDTINEFKMFNSTQA